MFHNPHANHSPSGKGASDFSERQLQGGGLLGKIEASPWLWGALATGGFYQAITHIHAGHEQLSRYFCSHPIQFIEAGFFFIGMSFVVDKFLRLLRERKVFDSLQGLATADPEQTTLDEQLVHLDKRLRNCWLVEKDTYWHSRLEHLHKFLSHRRRDGLDEHLKFLASTAEARLHESHSLLQMIVWALPSLGFLGTVMGVAMAIANIPAEPMGASLISLTGGMAVAFDTMAIGLVQALVLGFASLFVRHSEERLLNAIDHRVRTEVGQCLSAVEPSSPLVEAEARAAQEFLHKTESMIEVQTTLWQTSVEELRERWSETLDEQRQNLSRTLTTGAEATLVDHVEQLDQFRREFVAAYEMVTDRLTDDLRRMELNATNRDRRFEEALERFSTDFHLRLKAMWDAKERDEAFRASLTQAQLETWQQQMAALTDVMRDMSSSLNGQSETLLKIYDQEEHLAGMQQRLTENLEALRATEEFESAVHQLTGAVHLLMVRARRDAA